MEHTARAAVVPVAMGWSDLGSWDALWEMGEKDARGNALCGNVIAEDDAELLPALGSGARRRDRGRGPRRRRHRRRGHAGAAQPRPGRQPLVARLVGERRDEADALPTVHRPWGTYSRCTTATACRSSTSWSSPARKLSLQMHHHRAEHWVVVQGTARIVRGNEEMMLTEDQSTYIPLGTAHRLENPGKIPLHVIEVQSGSYLGEDDIVRFDDNYGRT